MNNTWIKLYRKIIDHDVFRDESAFRVFMWILCSVDYKTGSMISGRFWASERLELNSNTFYKILKRLEKKHDLVTLSSNNKNTTISVNNWSKYQADDNTSSNNEVTTKEQQSNTIQELRIKNKENNKDFSYEKWLLFWNERYSKSYRRNVNLGFKPNQDHKKLFNFWLNTLGAEKIIVATVLAHELDPFWSNLSKQGKLTPEMLIRRRGKNHLEKILNEYSEKDPDNYELLLKEANERINENN